MPRPLDTHIEVELTGQDLESGRCRSHLCSCECAIEAGCRVLNESDTDRKRSELDSDDAISGEFGAADAWLDALKVPSGSITNERGGAKSTVRRRKRCCSAAVSDERRVE